MIDMETLKAADKVFASAKSDTNYYMPNATFVEKGIDKDYIYFNVVAKENMITENQKENLQQKGLFIFIGDKYQDAEIKAIFAGQYKLRILK